MSTKAKAQETCNEIKMIARLTRRVGGEGWAGVRGAWGGGGSRSMGYRITITLFMKKITLFKILIFVLLFQQNDSQVKKNNWSVVKLLALRPAGERE